MPYELVPCRFLKTLWHLNTEATVINPAVHGAADTGQFLIMLLIRREKLLLDTVQTQQGQSRQSTAGITPAHLKSDRICRNFLMQFMQLRQNLKEEKRMLFAVAELQMLDHVAWQRFYVDAVKIVNCSCPMIVWHPKRNKCQVLDCSYVQTTQHALEQTLDGNVKSWVHRPWPV